ncbi:hypothetical protein AB0K74_13875 [Streptomyces sp. NPDC056159]|uniref:hypothetical protein n=1 Tax=unclassified Streptomyces TaxID=2593676 RepID=UPI00341B7A8E
MRFTSTPRGARLARRLAAVRLDAWGIPYGTDAHDAIVLIVAELTANAVRRPYMTRVKDLQFLTGHDSGTIVLGAAWVAPNPSNYGRGIHPDMVGFHIDVHPVDATQRAAIHAVLRAQALPQLHDWITQAIAADETWQLSPHQRYWCLSDGHLTHRDEA